METLALLKWMLNAVEAIACVIGFLYWVKIKDSHWRWFPFYLVAIVIAEILGSHFHQTAQHDIKLGMYNYVVIPLEILFFSWIFYKEFQTSRLRLIPLIAAALYAVCWLADMFLISRNPLWWVQSFSYTVGIILMLLLVLTYLYVLATGDGILFMKQNMMFWVCMGLFVFYFCSLPFFGVGNYLFSHYKNIYIGYAYAMYVLNIIMYSFFITAFIWGKPRYSYSSS
jgi:hypothetical protein